MLLIVIRLLDLRTMDGFIGQDDDDEFVDRSKRRKQGAGGRVAINKKNKLSLVFDPEARR